MRCRNITKLLLASLRFFGDKNTEILSPEECEILGFKEAKVMNEKQIQLISNHRLNNIISSYPSLISLSLNDFQLLRPSRSLYLN